MPTAEPISILSFPDEILQDIAHEASSALPELRLVCRRYSDIVSPQLFSHCVISYKHGKLQEFIDILQVLAFGEHPSTMHAKSLTIGELGPAVYPRRHWGDYSLHSKLIEQKLLQAIASFRQVTVATWYVRHWSSQQWTRAAVARGIAALPCLATLILDVELDNQSSVHLDLLPPLEVLQIRASRQTTISNNGSIRGVPELIAKSTAQLQQLSVKCICPTGEGQSVIYLLSLVKDDLSSLTDLTLEGFNMQLTSTMGSKLRSLDSLCLQNVLSNPTSYKDNTFASADDLWTLLERERIHLQKITIDNPTASFLRYLESYSNLRSLTITNAIGDSEDTSDGVALEFYSRTVACHATSLETLEVTPTYEGKWCFGEHALHAISQLVNIKHLSMAIIGDSALTVNDGCFYMVVPESGTPESEHDTVLDNFDPFDPVCLLLQTASLLPKLAILSIRGSVLACNRDTWCGSGTKYHAVDIPTQIHTHIMSFGPLDPSKYPFSVNNSGKMYRLQKLNMDGEFRYQPC